MRRLSVAAWTLAVLLLSWPLGVSPAAAADNVVMVLLDDARASDVAGMPTVQQLAREGTTFDHAYSSDPMCAPARAIIQTGLYTHRTGVTQNGIQQFVQSRVADQGGLQAVPQSSDLDHTFAVALHATGVYTGFVGKFINGVPKEVPGWDSFAVHEPLRGAESSVYYDYRIRIDGKEVTYGHTARDYSTDVYRGLALKDIEAAVAARRSFLTMVSLSAAHNPLQAPPRYADRPGDLRYRTLLAADDAIAAIVAQLKQKGQYDNTYIVVTSDQGLATGRKPAKGVAFEGSIRVPLVVKGPDVAKGVTLHQIVNHADLAPTFLDWLGTPPMDVDGRSLAPLLRGSTPATWRQAMPISHTAMSSAPDVPSWQGVRTTRYAYWKAKGGSAQLYDMQLDPNQRHNIVTGNPSLTQKLSRLTDELAECGGDGCRTIEDRGLD